MKDFTGSFCVINGRFEQADVLSLISLDSLSVCYEVIRVDDGIFLFLEDHLARLIDSLKNVNIVYNIDIECIINILLKLKKKNRLQAGNIKLLVAFAHGKERDPLYVVAYQVFHWYPTEKQYREGIAASLLAEERARPNVKYLNSNLQEKCMNEIKKRSVYEVLLVDHNGYITEGSKSNVFFIRGEILYTPPGDHVLKGITREKIFGLCRQCRYTIMEDNIAAEYLNQYSASFITGTSPKVLPVASIDSILYTVDHPLLPQLKALYETLILSYKTQVQDRNYRFDFR
jgi:branched-chain amino acid aminotransferase